MQAAAVFLCALALQAVLCTPIVQEFEESDNLVMGIPPHNEDITDPIVPQELVNGAFAENVEDENLIKGPKVNGGFAINIIPHEDPDAQKRLSNADCAGSFYTFQLTQQSTNTVSPFCSFFFFLLLKHQISSLLPSLRVQLSSASQATW
jgi:hypothetical protein